MRDEESFGRYVMGAYPELLRRARLLVGDRSQAEDLVQVALMSTYTHWSRVVAPDAYIKTVMARKVIGWRARRWNGERPTHPLPEELADVAGSDVDLSVAVRRALLALPPEQRAVVVLRYFDDCSEAEIAGILRCSPGTVKSRSARALAALRHQGLLAEEGLLQ